MHSVAVGGFKSGSARPQSTQNVTVTDPVQPSASVTSMMMGAQPGESSLPQTKWWPSSSQIDSPSGGWKVYGATPPVAEISRWKGTHAFGFGAGARFTSI